MSLENLIKDSTLTKEGKKLANDLFWTECDTHPCWGCSSGNIETKGPGGLDCPAEGLLTSRMEVDKILSLYMGPPPVELKELL